MAQATSFEARYAELLDSWASKRYPHGTELKDIPAGKAILGSSPEQQRDFVMAALAWAQGAGYGHNVKWWLLSNLPALFRRALPFAHDDMLALLGWMRNERLSWQLEPYLVKILERYLASNPRSPALDNAIGELVAHLDDTSWSADRRRRLLKLKEIVGIADADMPLQAGDVWADAAIAELQALASEQRRLWTELLQQCATASGSAPSARWRKATEAMVESIGAPELRNRLLRWMALAERPRESQIIDTWGHERSPLLMQERNVDVLRGLVWLCAGSSDRELSRALAALVAAFYRKVPGVGPRSVKLGNAGIWALGQFEGLDGMAQLSALKTRVRLPNALKQIGTALQGAAERAGVPPDEVEELLAPAYGLAAVGLRREQLGDITVELAVDGSAVGLRYLRGDGRRLASAPRALKQEHGEALAELTRAAADIKAMLPALRDRIEQTYLRRKSWPLAVWRERYLNHPLVGALARRLIWRFAGANRQRAGIWHNEQIVGSDGQALAGLGDEITVTLWHPLDDTTEMVLGWRDWLDQHELQQPFKQAHREIYLLTDAERATRVYSNRFAAHILRQHQFNALCAARGWKNQLRLMVDDSYPPASRSLPEWGLRAEYWVEGAGDTYGTDTNETGTYLYLSADQVRFYPIDAAQLYAHAGGGGYQQGWLNRGQNAEPIPLDQISPLVFSEILRDVDLFVGVASVGNDPTWNDGGPDGRYRDYWTHYAFGDLSETAKTRRAVLEKLIPRLKIAPRCRLTERFLEVRGDLRTYKIHLGSGNILMEPNNQYLCIVPGRGASATKEDTRFVPFEGDNTMAIILSKAVMLADDARISDPTITRQLKQ